MNPESYARFKDEGSISKPQPSYGYNNFQPQPPQQQQGGSGSMIGVNVPLQLGYGGYSQQVNVPVQFNADQYGAGGQFVAAQLNIGESGHVPKGSWTDGLFDCADSWFICILVCLCPCIRFGMTINRALPQTGFFKPCGLYFMFFGAFSVLWWVGGVFLPTEYLWIPSCIAFLPLISLVAYYRTQLRAKYDILGSIVWDFFVHWFCLLCALAQEARHVDRDYAVQV